MIAGTLLYIVYRRYKGLPLRETVKVVALTPLGVEEVEYRSVLVAFAEDDPFSTEAVITAKALAARRRRAIHVVSLVEVPSNLPLDAELAGAGGRRADEARAGEADLRAAGERQRRARAPRRRRAGDRGRGEEDQRGGDRDAAALPRWLPAVRQDAPDGAREAAVPGDRVREPERVHRGPARRCGAWSRRAT